MLNYGWFIRRKYGCICLTYQVHHTNPFNLNASHDFRSIQYTSPFKSAIPNVNAIFLPP